MKYYTKSHEWVEAKDGYLEVGISEHAVNELGEIVYVELPSVDDAYVFGEEAANVESVKAASPILSPIDGSCIEVNEELDANPGLLNEDWKTWIWRFNKTEFEMTNLMTEEEYLKYCEEN